MTDWHSCSVDEALRAAGSQARGLSDDEARRRLQEHGPNRLRPPRPASAISILVAQFRSVVTALLVGAMLVSLALGDRIEAAAIAVVIALNAGLGFFIELRARRAMEALLQLEAPHATVVRDGRLVVVDADVLVPGDVIEINAGQTIPADARVIAAVDLRVNEAALTGESLPVSKRPDALGADALLADRLNMLFTGTTSIAGTGRAVVTATGGRTEVGRIGILTGSLRQERTPLERRLDALGHRLVWLALGVAAVVAALGVLQGSPPGLMAQMAIALAVAAVPEGLPAVATIALAIGLRRMARRHTLVRRLPAVEALGSTTVICTDKTRTLTSGDMRVVRVWTPDADFDLRQLDAGTADGRLRAAIETALLASRTQPERAAAGRAPTGDPVDQAMLLAARHVGVDADRASGADAVAIVPFSSERKLMAAFYNQDGRLVAHVKGAPGRILEMSARSRTAAGDRPLTSETRAELLETNAGLAAQGLRVLAIATGEASGDTEAALQDLTFLGFVGLMDPPAPGVQDAIQRLRRAGLRTIMLTGDQRHTAEAIGRELGVLAEGDESIDSRELRALSREHLAERLARTGTFSRISPEDKLTIVEALQQQGEIVAMLGDGVNDAPALRKADVGVAMGIRGTDVAKEAAALVLQDDRFETIAAAVEEGRVIFDNIRKFVFYLFSCNLAEIVVLLVGAVLALPLPLLPLQILWLNLVTDTFPALALAVEPGDPDVMQRPPRDPQEAILSRAFMTNVAAHGVLIAASTLLAFAWALQHERTHATSVAFMTLALAQVFHLGNARSPEAVVSLRAALANRAAVAAVVFCILLQLAAVYVDPLPAVLRVAPLDALEWTVVLACAALTAVVGQGVRLWWARGRSRGDASGTGAPNEPDVRLPEAPERLS